MRKMGFVISLFLVLAVGFAIADSGRESTLLPPQEVQLKYSNESFAYRMKDTAGVSRWILYENGTQAMFDANGVSRFVIQKDGSIATYDSSGVTKQYFGNNTTTILTGTTTPEIAGGTGYVIRGRSHGNIFYIGPHTYSGDASEAGTTPLGIRRSSTVGGDQKSTSNAAGPNSGITLWLPTTITPEMDGWEFTIFNARNGVSEIVPYVGSSASGVTMIYHSYAGGAINGAGGVTPGAAAVASGVTMNAYGEWFTFVAKYQTTADLTGNTNHYILKDYGVTTTN